MKQIIDEIKTLECKIKAIGEIVTTLQQDSTIVSMKKDVRLQYDAETRCISGGHRRRVESTLRQDIRKLQGRLRQDEMCVGDALGPAPSLNSPPLADKNSQQYKDFKQSIWDTSHVDEACPPISSFLEKGEKSLPGLCLHR